MKFRYVCKLLIAALVIFLMSNEGLAKNFAGQWLSPRNLEAVRPAELAFPNFDDSLRKAMQRESELFFQNIVRDDGNLLDFLGANYTFVNERLARHYGIPNAYGDYFRRGTPDPALGRGGLLGQGSLLTVTSEAARTSPVKRGKMDFGEYSGNSSPTARPNVPELPEEPGRGRPASMRERMAQHRSNPVCASCHSSIDPLGLALENFDAVGQWRMQDWRRGD